MVVGQREVHHVADCDGILAELVGDDDRALNQSTGAEDGDLGLVDDRGVEEGSSRAIVGDGEGAAGQLVRGHLVVAGAGSEIANLVGQPSDIEITSVLDDRNQQPARGINGDADVLRRTVGNRPRLGVDICVEGRIGLEGFNDGLGNERQVGQTDSLAGLESSLLSVADAGDSGHVHLDGGRQLSRDLQGLNHPRGDDLA